MNKNSMVDAFSIVRSVLKSTTFAWADGVVESICGAMMQQPLVDRILGVCCGNGNMSRRYIHRQVLQHLRVLH
jgi:hypothetical protein